MPLPSKILAQKLKCGYLVLALTNSVRAGILIFNVEPEIQDPAELIENKLRFLVELHLKLGDQKIDVVIRRTAFKEELPIFRIARETGIQLL